MNIRDRIELFLFRNNFLLESKIVLKPTGITHIFSTLMDIGKSWMEASKTLTNAHIYGVKIRLNAPL